MQSLRGDKFNVSRHACFAFQKFLTKQKDTSRFTLFRHRWIFNLNLQELNVTEDKERARIHEPTHDAKINSNMKSKYDFTKNVNKQAHVSFHSSSRNTRTSVTRDCNLEKYLPFARLSEKHDPPKFVCMNKNSQNFTTENAIPFFVEKWTFISRWDQQGISNNAN